MDIEKAMTIKTEAPISGFVKPEMIIARAQEAAKALVAVVSQKVKPVIINNEQYLEYEDWQTVGEFYRYAVKTHDAVPVEINGVQGAKARAELINLDTGEILGGAEAYCMRDEEKWGTRAKYEWRDNMETGERSRVKVGDEIVPLYQLFSMAQTRAGAKAYRNRLAWVVVLAGYRPTPAEEMTEGTVQRGEEIHIKKHWCKIHKVTFFKKGNMKNFAHPIEGTKNWCDETSEEPPKVKSKAEIEKDKTDLYGDIASSEVTISPPSGPTYEVESAEPPFLSENQGQVTGVLTAPVVATTAPGQSKIKNWGDYGNWLMSHGLTMIDMMAMTRATKPSEIATSIDVAMERAKKHPKYRD